MRAAADAPRLIDDVTGHVTGYTRGQPSSRERIKVNIVADAVAAAYHRHDPTPCIMFVRAPCSFYKKFFRFVGFLDLIIGLQKLGHKISTYRHRLCRK